MAHTGIRGSKEVVTDVFEVVDDDAKVEIVTEKTEYREVVDIVGRADWSVAWKSYTLANGELLDLEDDGTFTEARTGRKLRRRAP